MEPFMNIVVLMDENNAIAHKGKIPWVPLPTDKKWYLTHATKTKDPSKRVAIVVGRLTFEDAMKSNDDYVSNCHFIVISSQSVETLFKTYPKIDKNHIDVVSSFDQATEKAKQLLDTPSAMIESVVLFGGATPYEQGLKAKVVKRIYLTRVFAKEPEYDTRVANFDLSDFQRIKRSNDELLAEFDDQIVEEKGWKYQFQVYERKNL